MSLTVPAALLEKARHGSVPDDEFVDCTAGSPHQRPELLDC